ncbi:MAG: peptidylprolyl isomerase [Bacteroidota bacterium]|nr:peptidylprolyl isomerase [Bacteroidota bacterium]
MSVIQRIRDKGAWIVFGIIALALIAFILQDSSFRRGNMFANTNTLGKVNGKAIDRTEFEEKVAMYGGRGMQREQLISQLWTSEVANIIMQQEYDKLGLSVTGKELGEILFSENSPFRREFTDPQTGEFKVDDARRAFDQIKKSKNSEQKQAIYRMYIEPAIQQALQTKYQALLQGSMYAPKWMVEKQQADDNAVASVSYVYVPYTSVSDSAVKVSDDEIMAYAKKHSKEYEKEEESRGIQYVLFDASASAADSAATLKQLSDQKAEFASATDMKAYFGKTQSELPYYDSYISKKEIKQKYIDSIVKVPVGGIYGPYLDESNFVLAKVIGEKSLPDSAKVRHILIATHQQDPQSGSVARVREDSTARRIMDTVEMELNAGKSFDSVCAKYSDDGNKNKGGVYDYFTTGRMVPTFNDFAFEKSVGSKGVIQTEYGFHYVEVLGQKGSSPAYKIAYLAKAINVSNETDNAALNAASQFAATSKDKKTFEENAAKLSKSVLPAMDIKENDYNISGLGDSRSLVRWIYEHSTGDITDQPMRVGDKYVVAIVTAVIKPGLPPAGILRPMVEQFVRNEKKAKQIIDTKFKGSTLEALASSTATSVQKIDSLQFSNPFIPGIGNDPKFSGASFNKSILGKVSDAIAGTSGVFAVRPDNIFAKAGTEDPNAIKQNIIQAQRMALYRGMDALRKAAVIKDYRSKFY